MKTSQEKNMGIHVIFINFKSKEKIAKAKPEIHKDTNKIKELIKNQTPFQLKMV